MSSLGEEKTEHLHYHTVHNPSRSAGILTGPQLLKGVAGKERGDKKPV